MLGYCPPAVSDVFLGRVVLRLLAGQRGGLEDELCAYLGSRAAAAGSSWVHVLALLLEELARRGGGRDEVILPSYSCNEFTKAALLAGLRPRYVDLQRDLAAAPESIQHAIGSRTLAVLAINNVGRESENGRIRAVCDRRGVLCIEDATYTFLGHSDHDGAKLGTYGHYAVLNFSEGKIIPVGGGAVVGNIAPAADVLAVVRARIAQRPAPRPLQELARLALYRAGSSRLGYTAYRILKQLTKVDLKKRMSMEPTRAGEVGHDLTRDAAGAVHFVAGREQALRDDAVLHPLGRAKQLVGLEVIRHADEIRAARAARYDAFRRALASTAAVELLPYPHDGMYIKAPFLLHGDPSPDEERELDRLGVIRGYSTAYPTYGDPAYPHGNLFFERLFTLPLHRAVRPRLVHEIAARLAAIRAPACVVPLRAPAE
jgi:dTDP-4-amino-4,6-dideoxygalactose transaminase